MIGLGLVTVWVGLDAFRRHVAKPPAMPTLRVDLVRGSAAELDLLPGIGPMLAGRIVEERERHGTFEDAAALERVPGIGPKTVERVRPYVDE